MLPKIIGNTPKMTFFSKKVEVSAPLQAERNFYVPPQNFLETRSIIKITQKNFGGHIFHSSKNISTSIKPPPIIGDYWGGLKP